MSRENFILLISCGLVRHSGKCGGHKSVVSPLVTLQVATRLGGLSIFMLMEISNITVRRDQNQEGRKWVSFNSPGTSTKSPMKHPRGLN